MKRLQLILKCSTAIAATSALATASHALAQEQTTEPDTQVATGSDEEVIIVEGTRASIGNSIDAKRNSDTIVDVLSADDADRFPDNNIAEGLSRIPGISFERDNDTSDGNFISIRGLDAAFNTVLNNGIRVGTANAFRRTALDIFTGVGTSTIEVTKVPLPEHASEGIGGVVDIRTRGALERSERFQLTGDIRDNSFADKVGFRIGGDFTWHIQDNFGVNLNVSFRRRFFNNFQIDPVGITLLNQTPTAPDGSVFTLPDGSTFAFDDDDQTGTIVSQIGLVPNNFFGVENFIFEEFDVVTDEIRADNLTIAGTIDWEITDTTNLTFGGRYSRRNEDLTSSRVIFDADDDGDFVNGVRTFDDSEISFEGSIEDEIETQQSYFLRGETKLDNWEFNYIAGYSRAFENGPETEIEFQNELEAFAAASGTNGAAERADSFAPFILDGPFASPNPMNLDAFLQALDPTLQNCTIGADNCGETEDFDAEIEDSRFNERWTARLDVTRFFDSDVLEYIRIGGLFEDSRTIDRDIDLVLNENNLDPDGTFNPNGTDNPGNIQTGETSVADFPDVLGSFGVARLGPTIGELGPFTEIPLFSRSGLINLRETFFASFAAAGGVETNFDVIAADEQFYTGYFQTKLKLSDKFSIIGGVRIEQYEADFASTSNDIDITLSGDPVNGPPSIDLDTGDISTTTISTSNFEVLPRIIASYDLTDNLRLRAGFSTAIARPNFVELAGPPEIELDIDLVDGIDLANATLNDIESVALTLESGNPNLRNTYSHNFDLSLEYYLDRQNAISIAGFYKKIDNFFFDSSILGGINSALGGPTIGSGTPELDAAIAQLSSGSLFSAEGAAVIDQLGGIEAILTSPNAVSALVQPVNGNTAEVYGVEIGILHTFSYLPGFLSNMGFIGNLTLQRTNTDINLGTLGADNILVQLGQANEGDPLIVELPFFNSPETIGNFSLFYEDRDFEAVLAYRFSGLQLEEIEEFGFNQFQQGRGFLDLDLQYTIRDAGPFSRLVFTFEASDILDSGRKPSTFDARGNSRFLSDNGTFNGRTFRLGARLRF